MITIIKFTAFGKPAEKVFYNNETKAQIHQVLSDICRTYEPLEITAYDVDGWFDASEIMFYLKQQQHEPGKDL